MRRERRSEIDVRAGVVGIAIVTAAAAALAGVGLLLSWLAALLATRP